MQYFVFFSGFFLLFSHRLSQNRGLKRSISTSSSGSNDDEDGDHEMENDDGAEEEDDGTVTARREKPSPSRRHSGGGDAAAPSTPKRAKKTGQGLIVSPRDLHLATNGDSRKKWQCWICSRSKGCRNFGFSAVFGSRSMK